MNIETARGVAALSIILLLLCSYGIAEADSTAKRIVPEAFKWQKPPDSLKVKTPILEKLSKVSTRAGGKVSLRPARDPEGIGDSLPTRMPKQALYASNCTVFVDYPQYALFDWLAGYEMYLAYQDLFFPLFNCDTLYPFVVTEVGMTLAFAEAGTMDVQVFLTGLDPIYSSPICPYPGDLLTVSQVYTVDIPYADVYTLIISFDTPMPVYGPYFAGFYFASDVTALYPGIAIDTAAYLCINYNDWGEGLIDLADNEYFPFPGSIHLFSAGYSKQGYMPKPHFIIPADSGVISPNGLLWSAELVDSIDFESCHFEYFKSGNWFVIGFDFDGATILRDGVNVAGNGNGWSYVWNPFNLPEGNYPLRIFIADLDSTYVSDTIVAYFDKKPLEPHFTGRLDLDPVCAPETIWATIEDENPTAVTFGYRPLPSYEDRSLTLLDRAHYGDVNGNNNDGNYAIAGEFGDYYGAPVLFASFMKHWYDKGYMELMMEGAQFQSIDQVVERFAAMFVTRGNLGTEDDNLVYGLEKYLPEHGGRVVPEFSRPPKWEWFKSNYLGKQATVALALQKPFGHWVAVQKVDHQNATRDSFPITLYDPAGGVLRQSYLLSRNDSLYIGYLPNNKRYYADLGVALHAKLETLTYLTFGTDFDIYDGWSGILPYGQQDLFYLIRAKALDADDAVAMSYWIAKYDCSPNWIRGDVNASGIVNIADVTYLVAYIFNGGPPPNPEATVGDANCSGGVNLADAVYIVQYIFSGGPAPCSP